MMRWRARLAPLVRDALEWWVLPGLAVFLPWSWCFRFYRRCCMHPFLFREKVDAALAQLPAALNTGQAGAWAARHRLVLLIDRADAFLSRFRGNRWLDRHVHRSGDPWPEVPFIGITFHFGAGLWSLRDICRHGRRISFVSIRFEQFFRHARLAHCGALWRIREVARAGNAPVIYTGGSKQSIRDALADGVSVAGLIDVPATLAPQASELDFLGASAWFPPGLLTLASERQTPVVVYAMDVDYTSGQRKLVVRRLVAENSGAQLAEAVGFLAHEIERNSPAWHNWPELQAFRGNAGAR